MNGFGGVKAMWKQGPRAMEVMTVCLFIAIAALCLAAAIEYSGAGQLMFTAGAAIAICGAGWRWRYAFPKQPARAPHDGDFDG